MRFFPFLAGRAQISQRTVGCCGSSQCLGSHSPTLTPARPDVKVAGTRSPRGRWPLWEAREPGEVEKCRSRWLADARPPGGATRQGAKLRGGGCPNTALACARLSCPGKGAQETLYYGDKINSPHTISSLLRISAHRSSLTQASVTRGHPGEGSRRPSCGASEARFAKSNWILG